MSAPPNPPLYPPWGGDLLPQSSPGPSSPSCASGSLPSNCSFFFTFSPLFLFLQQQFHWDLHDAYFIESYCEQLPIVRPKSIPKYKYLSALG